jgi:hypothetical protein
LTLKKQPPSKKPDGTTFWEKGFSGVTVAVVKPFFFARVKPEPAKSVKDTHFGSKADWRKHTAAGFYTAGQTAALN